MEPRPELSDAPFRQQVRQARLLTPEQKLATGPRPFDDGCGWWSACLRDACPDMREPTAELAVGICVHRLFGR